MVEPLRISSLDDLRIDMRGLVIQWREALAQMGIAIRVLETRRSPERQEWLFASGRTRPGPIVTHVSGHNPRARHVAEPGQATALDFCFAGADPWHGPWELCGQAWEHIAAQQHGVWGGRWTFKDLGHIEINDPAHVEVIA